MISPTQTMENTTFDFTPSFKNPDDMPEHVSIYDKPKRGRGRPKTCKLSDEEKRQRKIEINRKYYQDNYEYCLLRQRLYKQKMSDQKMKFRKPIFFGFPKNEFLFKGIKSVLYTNQKIKANQIIIILSYSEMGSFLI